MSRVLSFSSRAIPTLLGLALSGPAAAQTYRIRELPPPNPNGNSIGAGINEAGVVVGQGRAVSGAYRAMRWINGSPADLSAMPGFSVSAAYGISNDDRVVGRSGDVCSPTNPTLWTDGEMSALPDVPRVYVEVYKLNDAGIAVGEGVDSCNRPWNDAAYQWEYEPQLEDWSVSSLPPLTGDPEAAAYDVDSVGVAAGFSGDSSTARIRACRWDNRVASPLPDLGGGLSFALGINDVGQLAGYSRTATGAFRAFFLDETTAIDLGTLSGYSHSAATKLNNAGTVIGFAFNGTGETTIFPYWYPDANQRALLWRDGILHDMNDLIPAGSGWTSLNALLDINEHGQIAGYGERDGQYRAFLLTPNLPADMNCDDLIDFFDIDPFLLALFSSSQYTLLYPACDFRNADVNGDGHVSFFDIDPFLACLFGNCP